MPKAVAELRYENAEQSAFDIMNQVRKDHFEYLEKARIQILFDTRKKMKGPKLVLATIMKASDLVRKLTEQLAPGGCDYIILIDKIAYMNSDLADRTRLIRHELRHCSYNPFAKKPWQLIPHDIEDFEIEISLNKSNAGWANRISQIVSDIYEQQKEDEKEKKAAPVAPVHLVKKQAAG